MKSVIAAVAMLLLLTLTLTGTRSLTKCSLEKRAKASNLDWRHNTANHTSEAMPSC